MTTPLIIFLIIITFVITFLSIAFNVTLLLHTNKICDDYLKCIKDIADKAHNYHLSTIQIIQKFSDNATEKQN